MRILVLGYALVAYLLFLLSSAWATYFLVAGVDGPATHPAWAALAVDSGLLLAFAAQHSIMARAGIKRFLPAAAERATYVLAASLLLIAMFVWWQPVPAVVWNVGLPWSPALWAVYGAGWALVVWATFMVDHADFLGLKQAYAHWRSRPYAPPRFTARRMYAWCRHPMMLGLVITFWATPRMTAGHLFFAVASTAYIGVGIRFEERDLRARLGSDYEAYAARVPALVPRRPPVRVDQ